MTKGGHAVGLNRKAASTVVFSDGKSIMPLLAPLYGASTARQTSRVFYPVVCWGIWFTATASTATDQQIALLQCLQRLGAILRKALKYSCSRENYSDRVRCYSTAPQFMQPLRVA